MNSKRSAVEQKIKSETMSKLESAGITPSPSIGHAMIASIEVSEEDISLLNSGSDIEGFADVEGYVDIASITLATDIAKAQMEAVGLRY